MRGDEADNIRFRHLARHQAAQIARLFDAPEIIPRIFGGFEAGTMLEFHVRKIGGDFNRRIHVFKTCRENHVKAFLRVAANHALDVRPGHAFRVGRFHAHFLFKVFPPQIMRIRPAVIANRRDINKRRFQFFFLRRRPKCERAR